MGDGIKSSKVVALVLAIEMDVESQESVINAATGVWRSLRTLLNVNTHVLQGMWWLLVSIWCIIYLGHAYLNRSSSPLLPAYANHVSRRPSARGGHVKTSLRFLQFKVTITSWNAAHDRLVSLLFKRRRAPLYVFLEWFYNFGSVLGVAGMLIAVVVLLRVSFLSGWTLLQKMSAPKDVHTLMRRSVAGGASPMNDQDATFGGLATITPIVRRSRKCLRYV